jgi:hypothetical protein
VRRLPDRGRYDRTTIEAILDAGFVCHLGFIANGQPYVIPTGYARAGDRLYIHGSAASRLARTLAGGVDVCLTVTLVDGFVLARSAFHHSMNYRSAVVLGRARAVTDADEKMEALRLFTNHLIAGRFEEVRAPSAQELKATAVLALDIDEASAKLRSGPPIDDADDYAIDVWAGVVPLVTSVGEPAADAGVPAGSHFDTSRLVTTRRRGG